MTEKKRTSLWANVEPTTPPPPPVEIPDDWMPDPEDIRRIIEDVNRENAKMRRAQAAGWAAIKDKVIR